MKRISYVLRIGLFIFSLLFWACEERPLYLFDTYTSPDERFQLKVFYTDPPIFGPHDICFKVLEIKTLQETEKDCRELDNDGANLSDHNIQVYWLNNQTAQIILDGEQQKADTLMLKMD